MKKHLRQFVFSLLTAFLFSGCGQEAGSPVSDSGEESAVNWQEEGFAPAGEVTEADGLLGVQELVKWELPETAAYGVISSGTAGDGIWRLLLKYNAAGEYMTGAAAEYCYEEYHADSGETESVCFTPKELGMTEEIGYIEGMSAGADDMCLLRWVSYTKNTDQENAEELYLQTGEKLVLTDFGQSCESFDFYDVFLEQELETVSPTILPMWNELECMRDAAGNFYVLSGGSELSVFDAEQNPVWKGDILQLFLTDTGEAVIVSERSDGTYAFSRMDAKEGGLRELCVFSDCIPEPDSVLGMWGNVIFYMERTAENTHRLIRWNVGTGKREVIFDFDSSGINFSNFSVELAQNGKEEPVLCLKNERSREIWISSLAAGVAETRKSIVIADLAGGGELLAKCALTAQMDSPDTQFVYQESTEEEEKERIAIELTKKSGPDILCVSREDMHQYAEKGILSELSGLIDENDSEALLPGAIETGRIDGELYGLPLGFAATTFAAAGDRAIPDGWNPEDLAALADAGELSCAIRSPYVFGTVLPSDMALLELTRYQLCNGALVDLDRKECHFTDEAFVKLLDCVRNAGIPETTDAWFEAPEALCWGYLVNYANFISFFEHIELEEAKIVGYPDGAGYVGYLRPSGGMVVVNRNTKNPEAVREFLEILLSKEMQESRGRDCLGIRKLTASDYYTEEDGRLYLYGNRSIEVPVFADGTNALERAAEFLEQCGGAPYIDSAVSGIVNEEICFMLDNGRSTAETAEILNNRVQLYLDTEG